MQAQINHLYHLFIMLALINFLNIIILKLLNMLNVYLYVISMIEAQEFQPQDYDLLQPTKQLLHLTQLLIYLWLIHQIQNVKVILKLYLLYLCFHLLFFLNSQVKCFMRHLPIIIHQYYCFLCHHYLKALVISPKHSMCLTRSQHAHYAALYIAIRRSWSLGYQAMRRARLVAR